jgi:hypothetical protein
MLVVTVVMLNILKLMMEIVPNYPTHKREATPAEYQSLLQKMHSYITQMVFDRDPNERENRHNIKLLVVCALIPLLIFQ